MAGMDTGRERGATLDYCLEMMGQVAELLQSRAGEPELAAILRALVSSQRLQQTADAEAPMRRRTAEPGRAAREAAAFS